MPKRPADPSAEYVLAYHHPVYARDPGEVRVPKGTVVVDVTYRPEGSLTQRTILGGATTLEFTVKETGEKFSTNYGYMFALDTPENRSRLAEVDRLRALRDEAERRFLRAEDEVEKVAGPSEGTFLAG